MQHLRLLQVTLCTVTWNSPQPKRVYQSYHTVLDSPGYIHLHNLHCLLLPWDYLAENAKCSLVWQGFIICNWFHFPKIIQIFTLTLIIMSSFCRWLFISSRILKTLFLISSVWKCKQNKITFTCIPVIMYNTYFNVCYNNPVLLKSSPFS